MSQGSNINKIAVALQRFNISPPPDPSEEKYEEKLTNWYLEGAFFRDFVFREQKGKGIRGDLADGLVLFDKTALFVQSKAQTGTKDSKQWAKKNIHKALTQVCYGERMLRERLVSHVVSETLGTVSFDPDRFQKCIGLIVLDQEDTTPYEAGKLVPEITQHPFPVHVISLADLIEVSWRFDTAPDFLFYLEERRLLALGGVPLQIHREIEMASIMLDLLPHRLRQHKPDISEDIHNKSVEAFRSLITGELHESDRWRSSMLVDDIIAHLHNRDPELPWNHDSSLRDTIETIVLLSYLDRVRRAQIGEKMMRAAQAAIDGKPRTFWHATRFNDCCYTFLYSDLQRQERLDLAKDFYLPVAMAKSGMNKGLVVATNSIAPGGRAYDVAVQLHPLTDQERDYFISIPDPFGI